MLKGCTFVYILEAVGDTKLPLEALSATCL